MLRYRLTLVGLAACLLLSACAAPTATPSPTAPAPTMSATSAPPTAEPPTASPTIAGSATGTEAPTATTTATHTATTEPSPTHTAEPSATHTATRVPATAGPTVTPMPTATLTPQPGGGPVLPGLYVQSPVPCAPYEVLNDYFWIQVAFCTVSVRVQPETGNMDFNVIWQVTFLAGPYANKPSDADNRSMYLVDHQGRRYDHIQTNGAARLGGGANSKNGPGPYVIDGVFVFGPAQPGATLFDFYDDDQGVVIRNISLAGAPQP